MQFPCNCTNDQMYFRDLDSLEELSSVTPACIAILIVGLFGLTHNAVLLLIAYRIKWFQYYQFFFIVNQAMVDFLTSGAFTCVSVRILCYSYTRTPDILTMTNCLLSYLPANILFTCTQRCALIVAVDRLYSVLFPFSWVKLQERYRYSLIAIAWTWAIGQECGWFFFLDSAHVTNFNFDIVELYSTWDQTNKTIVETNLCVTACLPRSIVPQGVWWNMFSIVCDTGTSVSIILLYVILPGLASSLCRRVAHGNGSIRVYLNNMQQQQQKIMIRVRLISFITLASYVCTMCVAVAVMDLFADLAFLTVPWSLLNTVPPLYLLAWKDEVFRKELKKTFLRVFNLCREDATQLMDKATDFGLDSSNSNGVNYDVEEVTRF